MTVDRIEDFQALEPFFRVIEDGLAGLVDGGHFFDLLADDVVFEFIITVPDYPRRIAGRDNLIDLYLDPLRVIAALGVNDTNASH
jgi:hypothetical protein